MNAMSQFRGGSLRRTWSTRSVSCADWESQNCLSSCIINCPCTLFRRKSWATKNPSMLCLNSGAATFGGPGLRGLLRLCPSWTGKARNELGNEWNGCCAKCDIIGQQMKHTKDADPELRHSTSAAVKFRRWRLRSSASFDGPFKLGQLCCAECDVIGPQMQPSKDAAPELGRSPSDAHMRRKVGYTA